MKQIIPLVLIAAAAFGGKAFLEHQGARMVEVAQEMSEDGHHDEALDKIRTFETWFGWTPSAEQAQEIKDHIRRRQRSASQEEAQKRQFNKLNRDLEEERKNEQKHQREMERLDKRMEQEKFRIREENKKGKRSRLR